MTPLSESPVEAAYSFEFFGKLFVFFHKADLDNNVPEGDDVPPTLVAK